MPHRKKDVPIVGSAEPPFTEQAIHQLDSLVAAWPLEKQIGAYRECLRLAYQVLDELHRANHQQRVSLRKVFKPIPGVR